MGPKIKKIKSDNRKIPREALGAESQKLSIDALRAVFNDLFCSIQCLNETENTRAAKFKIVECYEAMEIAISEIYKRKLPESETTLETCTQFN